ncbi:unnamed protein product, partial [Prorocentrum cordatum]
MQHAHYVSVIGAYSRWKLWQRAVSVLAEMEQADVRPDLRTFTALMGACARGRRWAGSLQLLGAVEGRGLRADAVTWQVLAKAAAAGRSWAHAVGLMARMRQQDLEPGVAVVKGAVVACIGQGQWPRACRLLEELPGCGGAGVLGEAACALGRGSYVDQARVLLLDVRARGLQL